MHGGKGCIHIDKLIKKIKAIKFYDLDPPPFLMPVAGLKVFWTEKKLSIFLSVLMVIQFSKGRHRNNFCQRKEKTRSGNHNLT